MTVIFTSYNRILKLRRVAFAHSFALPCGGRTMMQPVLRNDRRLHTGNGTGGKLSASGHFEDLQVKARRCIARHLWQIT